MKTIPLLSDNELWPNYLAERIYSGFSDNELEFLCEAELSGYEKALPLQRTAWIYWASELYSFGRCYREWLGLPQWFPLPLYGDHGVDLSGGLCIDEKSNKVHSHLTWFSDRAKSLKNNFRKRIIRMPHPWILFRRKHDLKKKENAKGTLIFFSHTVPGSDIHDYDFDQYFSQLLSVLIKKKPVVICMHQHDINKGYHLKIRKYGIPVITAGNTASPYFVERFYSLISRFDWATSNMGGSELFYCEDLGVRYFIWGEDPIYFNHSMPHRPKGQFQYRDQVDESSTLIKKKIFSTFPPEKTPEKQAFVNSALGLDVDENEARRLVIRELKKELLRHALQVTRVFIIHSLRQIFPPVAIEWIKKMKLRIRKL